MRRPLAGPGPPCAPARRMRFPGRGLERLCTILVPWAALAMCGDGVQMPSAHTPLLARSSLARRSAHAPSRHWPGVFEKGMSLGLWPGMKLQQGL